MQKRMHDIWVPVNEISMEIPTKYRTAEPVKGDLSWRKISVDETLFNKIINESTLSNTNLLLS